MKVNTSMQHVAALNSLFVTVLGGEGDVRAYELRYDELSDLIMCKRTDGGLDEPTWSPSRALRGFAASWDVQAVEGLSAACARLWVHKTDPKAERVTAHARP